MDYSPPEAVIKLSALTKTGDSVIMLTPIYKIYKVFFNMIENHKLLLVESLLLLQKQNLFNCFCRFRRENSEKQANNILVLFATQPNWWSVDFRYGHGCRAR